MALERDTVLHKRYRVVEILGQGGMGSVYRAVDENLGVDVAVKENLFTTDEYARQFRLEAVILANLRHANLPRVSDHFVVGEQGQYLIMDFIEGEDLRQRMERTGTISEDDAIQIGAAMCEALGYLHSRKPSILHRDLKPGNVKITPDGHIFLVDFGLAKLVQAGQATSSGARAMTPGYSPPEQYGGARTDARSDIYSLGATLYAALTGNVPEDGLARAMDNAQLTPLRKRNPKISRRLAAAIEKAMAIDPSDRFQQAEEFKRALLNSKSKTIQIGPAYAVSPPPEAAERERERVEIVAKPEVKQGPFLAQPVMAEELPFVSPQKKQLQRERRRARTVRRLVLATLVIVVASISAMAPGVLPASLQLIAMGLRLPEPTATLPALVPTAPATGEPLPTALPLTPTGIIVPTPTLPVASTRVSRATPTALPVVVAPPAATEMGGGAGMLAFSSTREGVPQIYVKEFGASTDQQLTDLEGGACQPAWSPDGQRLLFASPCGGMDEVLHQARLYGINADGTGLTEVGGLEGGGFDPAWSPDGGHIAFTSMRTGVSEIFLFDMQDQMLTQLTYGSADHQSRQPAWSPDGRQIAYTVKRYDRVFQVWLMDATGGNQRQLVRSGIAYSDYLPAWTADGGSILFTHRRADVVSLPYLMTISASAPPDGLGVALDLRVLPIEDATLSPDGAWIVFEGQAEGQDRDILAVSINGDEVVRLTSTAGLDFDPACRPNPLP